jgi:hypothetical protein
MHPNLSYSKEKNLAIVAIVKNEAFYINEWITYHLNLGITHIYLYDNESTDDTKIFAECFSDVTVLSWATVEGVSPQFSAYTHFLTTRPTSHKWSIFIDIDEFIVPSKGNLHALFQLIESAPSRVGGIALNQRLFGSSGSITYEDKPVMQRFVLRAEDNDCEHKWFKSLVRLDAVKSIADSHRFELEDGYYYVDCDLSSQNFEETESRNTKIVCDNVMIYHYMLKSRNEFLAKRQRGGSASKSVDERLSRFSDDYFYGRDAIANKIRDLHGAELSRYMLRREDNSKK